VNERGGNEARFRAINGRQTFPHGSIKLGGIDRSVFPGCGPNHSKWFPPAITPSDDEKRFPN